MDLESQIKFSDSFLVNGFVIHQVMQNKKFVHRAPLIKVFPFCSFSRPLKCWCSNHRSNVILSYLKTKVFRQNYLSHCVLPTSQPTHFIFSSTRLEIIQALYIYKHLHLWTVAVVTKDAFCHLLCARSSRGSFHSPQRVILNGFVWAQTFISCGEEGSRCLPSYRISCLFFCFLSLSVSLPILSLQHDSLNWKILLMLFKNYYDYLWPYMAA